MAYDARRSEVLEALRQTDFDAAQKEIISKTLERYFARREGYLHNLLEVLPPGRSDPAHAAWLDRAKGAMGMVLEAFNGAEAGRLWLAALANEEHAFFYQVHMSQVPVLRDKMMKHKAALEQAMKEFKEKWEKIKSADKDVDEKLKKVAEQYEEELEAAAKAAARIERETKEVTAEKVRTWLQVGLALVDLGVIELVIKAGAAALGVKLDQEQARKLEIFALLSLEETVIATFTEAREIVKEFLHENNYPEIKDTWDRGDDAAEALEGAMATAGQKRDAADFGKALKDELAKVFAVAEGAYKEFAREHEYLFFGPLGANYYMELAEDDTWKRFSENWQKRRADFDELIQARIFEPNPDKLVEVSLEGLSSDDRQRIYSQLEGALRELMQAWNKWKEDNNDPYWVLKSREELKRVLEAMR
jgi:hypothetical protein